MPYKDPKKNQQASADWKKRNPEKAKRARAEWEKRNPEKRHEYIARYEARGAPPSGLAPYLARWTPQEEKVLAEWEGSDIDLSLKLGRTPLSIRIRRTRMKKEGRL